MSSSISAQQRSVQESSRQFETRMLNMVSLLTSADSIFFYKRVTKSMATEVVKGPFAYALEFPLGFLREYSKKFGANVTFELKDTERTWPIKLTVRAFKYTRRDFTGVKVRVFAYGAGGWKKFVTENQISIGDILIFHLIGLSQFQVVIGRAPINVHPNGHGDHNEGEVDMDIDVGYQYDDQDNKSDPVKWFRNASPWWNAHQAQVSCRVCKLAPPFPRFLVTIRPSFHFSLAVPGHFWEVHDNMLEHNELQLRGPNKAICIVVAKRNYDGEEKKLCVRLESGWPRFFIDNTLKVGNILEFYLVGNSCFTVDLVEQINNY